MGKSRFLLRQCHPESAFLTSVVLLQLGDYHLPVLSVNCLPSPISNYLSHSPQFTSALELTHLHSSGGTFWSPGSQKIIVLLVLYSLGSLFFPPKKSFYSLLVFSWGELLHESVWRGWQSGDFTLHLHWHSFFFLGHTLCTVLQVPSLNITILVVCLWFLNALWSWPLGSSVYPFSWVLVGEWSIFISLSFI